MEIKLAETQLEEQLQDLRAQVECARLEAELLSQEEQNVEPTDSLVNDKRVYLQPKGDNHESATPNAPKVAPPANNVAIHSTPKQDQSLDYRLPFSTIPKGQHEADAEQDNTQRYNLR